MSHLTEFPNVVVPSIITEAVASGVITDCSWSQDVCPSFCLPEDDESAIRLWAEYEEIALREYPEQPRFNVSTDEGKVIYQGEDPAAALAALINAKKAAQQAVAVEAADPLLAVRARKAIDDLLNTRNSALVIYQSGEANIRTSVTTNPTTGENWADFTAEVLRDKKQPAMILGMGPNKMAEAYVDELNSKRDAGSPEFRLMPWAEVEPLIEAIKEANHVTPWVPITEARWHEMMGALPPEKWQIVGEVEIFRMSEYMISDITDHFARFGGMYFSRSCRITESYDSLAAQVRRLATSLAAESCTESGYPDLPDDKSVGGLRR
jgi:hypothetical protein